MAWQDKEDWEQGVDHIIGTRTIVFRDAVRRGMLIDIDPDTGQGFPGAGSDANSGAYAGFAFSNYEAGETGTVVYAGRYSGFNDTGSILPAGARVHAPNLSPGSIVDVGASVRSVGYLQDPIPPYSWGIVIIDQSSP